MRQIHATVPLPSGAKAEYNAVDTAEGLVQQALNSRKIGQRTIPAELLQRTDFGRQMFTWSALYADRSLHLQYPEVFFYRTLTDSEFVPPTSEIVSVDRLDKEQVVEFTLYPIAITRKICPYFSRDIRTVINLQKGERLQTNWCTDYNANSQELLRRQVVGIRRGDNLVLTVFSPTGGITIATTEDVSFDGE